MVGKFIAGLERSRPVCPSQGIRAPHKVDIARFFDPDHTLTSLRLSSFSDWLKHAPNLFSFRSRRGFFFACRQGEMITVPNGDFQSAVNSSGDVTSHTGVVSGNWQGSSSLETGFDSDVGSNVLRRFGSTNSGTSGHMREYSQYNFIDVSSNSGLHRLDFDFKRYQTPGSGKAQVDC